VTLARLQLTQDDMHVVMELVDLDKDGVVSLADFRAFLAAGLREPAEGISAGGAGSHTTPL
jgi:hypothetical protein